MAHTRSQPCQCMLQARTHGDSTSSCVWYRALQCSMSAATLPLACAKVATRSLCASHACHSPSSHTTQFCCCCCCCCSVSCCWCHWSSKVAALACAQRSRTNGGSAVCNQAQHLWCITCGAALVVHQSCTCQRQPAIARAASSRASATSLRCPAAPLSGASAARASRVRLPMPRLLAGVLVPARDPPRELLRPRCAALAASGAWAGALLAVAPCCPHCVAGGGAESALLASGWLPSICWRLRSCALLLVCSAATRGADGAACPGARLGSASACSSHQLPGGTLPAPQSSAAQRPLVHGAWHRACL